MNEKQREEMFITFTEIYDSLLQSVNNAGGSHEDFKVNNLQEMSASRLLSMLANNNIRFRHKEEKYPPISPEERKAFEANEEEEEEDDEKPKKIKKKPKKIKKKPGKKHEYNLSAKERDVLSTFLDAFFDAVDFPEEDDCVAKFYKSVFDQEEDAEVLEVLHQDLNDTLEWDSLI